MGGFVGVESEVEIVRVVLFVLAMFSASSLWAHDIDFEKLFSDHSHLIEKMSGTASPLIEQIQVNGVLVRRTAMENCQFRYWMYDGTGLQPPTCSVGMRLYLHALIDRCDYEVAADVKEKLDKSLQDILQFYAANIYPPASVDEVWQDHGPPASSSALDDGTVNCEISKDTTLSLLKNLVSDSSLAKLAQSVSKPRLPADAPC